MGSIKRSLANNITTGGAFDATDLSGTIPSTNVADASLTNLTSFSPALGDTIESVSSDPSPATEGQFWYNSTSGALKGLVKIQAWSSAGNLANARTAFAGCGTQTSALAFGGGPPNSNSTEEYSGYTWATGGNLGTARRAHAGAGTQTAGLAMAGFTTVNTNATEEYDGSTWSPGGNMATARESLSAAGTQTAGLGFGGYTTTIVANTEEYDGSAWTAGGNLGTARYVLAGAGTQTAGLAAGGKTTVVQSVTEEYDGSAWTSGGTMNTARSIFAGAGTQNLGLVFGGNLTPTGSSLTGATELYDGTTWTTSSATMGTSRRGHGGAGSMTAGLAFGGTTPANTAATEEFDSSINTPLSGVWAAGGNVNTARRGAASGGNQTAMWMSLGNAGSDIPPYGTTLATEEYNGSTWTSVNNNIGNARYLSGGTGPESSAIAITGFDTTAGNHSTPVTEYDGTNWTSGTAYPASTWGVGASGTQTATLTFGAGASAPGAKLALTNKYDGTTWTSTGSLNTARGYIAGCGTQTATLAMGGRTGTPSFSGEVESFNGTTWTTKSSMNSIGGNGGGSGSSTSAIAFTGTAKTPTPGSTSASELWDDISWTSAPPLATARNSLAFGNGSPSIASIAATGYSGGPAPAGQTSSTEEWSGPQTTATASTITTS